MLISALNKALISALNKERMCLYRPFIFVTDDVPYARARLHIADHSGRYYRFLINFQFQLLHGYTSMCKVVRTQALGTNCKIPKVQAS